ncbi:MAG: hypothetical protein ACK4K5_09620 [Thermosynechococcus sp.]|uniref:hypothetical protein n=1 Tax=Thermosynechococcus sp. TaxID=2814275 RepID=UPI0039192E33
MQQRFLPSALGRTPTRSPPPVPAIVAQQAQPAGATFYADRGEGLFRISGRPSQKVTFMSIAIDPQKVVDINMQLADGNYIGFGGNVIQQDEIMS